MGMREEGGIVYNVWNVDPIAASIDNVNLDSLNINHHHYHSCRIHLLYGPRLFFMSAKMSEAWNWAILTLLRVCGWYVRFSTFLLWSSCLPCCVAVLDGDGGSRVEEVSGKTRMHVISANKWILILLCFVAFLNKMFLVHLFPSCLDIGGLTRGSPVLSPIRLHMAHSSGIPYSSCISCPCLFEADIWSITTQFQIGDWQRHHAQHNHKDPEQDNSLRSKLSRVLCTSEPFCD